MWVTESRILGRYLCAVSQAAFHPVKCSPAFELPRRAMKDPTEVLRRKEDELQQLKEEVEALRMVGKLLKEHPQDKDNQRQTRGVVIQMPDAPVNLA